MHLFTISYELIPFDFSILHRILFIIRPSFIIDLFIGAVVDKKL